MTKELKKDVNACIDALVKGHFLARVVVSLASLAWMTILFFHLQAASAAENWLHLWSIMPQGESRATAGGFWRTSSHLHLVNNSLKTPYVGR